MSAEHYYDTEFGVVHGRHADPSGPTFATERLAEREADHCDCDAAHHVVVRQVGPWESA